MSCNPYKLTAATRDAIVAAYAAGKPVKQIAADFQVDGSYPSQLAKRRGLPRRYREQKR